MENKRKYGLRCVTPQGYKDIHVSEVFSEQFVQEMNDVDEKGLSLSDLFTEMVCMASATVGAVDNGCTTVHAKPLTIARDMENYGVDVVVDMREAKSIVTALYGKGTVCTLSVRDAILCYAVAETLKLKVGAKVEMSRDLIGVRLVDDPSVKPKTTLVQLLNYWGKLKRAAQERTKMQCACKDIIPTRDADQLVGWLVSLAGRKDKAFDGALFEFLPKRGVQLHTVELCGWSLNKSPYVPYTVSVRNLKNAVCVGFDRYLHDVKRLCCGRACGCVPYGVRETEDGEWLIANRFLCDGERVRGVTHEVEIMLRNAGLQQLTGKEIDWFQYSKDTLLNIEGTFADKPVVRKVGDVGLCGCTRFEMLIAWFDFIREGKVMLIDVARAVNFQLLDGLYSGTVNCHWVSFGGMRITGAYKCICNGKHEVCGRVIDNVLKGGTAVKVGCDSFLCGDDPVEHAQCCSAG